jgi:transposase
VENGEGDASQHLRWDGDDAERAASVTASGPRRDGLLRALGDVRELARSQADDILRHVPDTGDRVTGRAVDDFVDQAADALRALEEAVAETLRRLEDERP